MRTVLEVTLYITLLIDLCGRSGDITRHPQRPEHMCLRWENVALYCFSNDKGAIDIRANVKVRWSKGQSLDELAYRIITLPGLLPTSFATQDTLQIFLIIAIMDGVIRVGEKTIDFRQSIVYHPVKMALHDPHYVNWCFHFVVPFTGLVRSWLQLFTR